MYDSQHSGQVLKKRTQGGAQEPLTWERILRYGYGLLQLTPEQFWAMAWADFWEMLDGRIWWELRKAGVAEKREYSADQIRQTRDWLTAKAEKRGWTREQG